jgi:WD40 repeat protein
MENNLNSGLGKVREKFSEINKKPAYILAAFFVFSIIVFFVVYLTRTGFNNGSVAVPELKEYTVETAKLAEIPNGYTLDPMVNQHFEYFINNVGFSSDGKTAIFAAHDKNGAGFVFVNDIKYGPYSNNKDGYYASGYTLSKDGKRFAFIAEGNGIETVVVDGREQGRYEKVSSLTFSPDGKKTGFVGLKGGLDFVVIDGFEIKRLSPDSVVPGSLVFSYDGRIFSYIERLANVNGVRAVIDGAFSGEYGCISTVIFSPQGNGWACVSKKGAESFVIGDGQEGKSYEFISPERILFSPNGEKTAYIAYSGGKNFAVVNGQESRPYEDIEGEVFSYDGKDLMYLGLRDGHWFSVVGDSEEELSSAVSGNKLFFALSEESYGYIATDSGRKFFVFEGKNGPFYNDIDPGSVVVADNGKEFAYVAQKFPSSIIGEAKNYLVMSGREMDIDYRPTKLRFSADGSMLMFGTIKNDRDIWWVAQKISDIPENPAKPAEISKERQFDCPENKATTPRELLDAASSAGQSGDGKVFSCYFSFAMRQKYIEVFSDSNEVNSLAKSIGSAKKMEGGEISDSMQIFEAKYSLNNNEYPIFVRVEKDQDGKWLISGF